MLYLYQSNHLERLVDLLDAVVKIPLSHPFAPETVVVPSKGMGRWISLQLAERNGICANMEFPLPASFLWQLLRDALGDLPTRSGFDPETLTWRIMALLENDAHLADAPRLKAYIQGGDDFRRYELAARIADTFDQYLVYRPDWIANWERGELSDLGPDEAWQSHLWRHLAAGPERAHRARLLSRLFDRLAEGNASPNLPERVVFFGLSALPPVLLEVIRALAERTDVCLFALNPCREAWGEIRDRREIARQAGDAEESEVFLEVGNPLLASLGKQGREFFDSVQGDFPELQSLFDEASEIPGTILDTLQRDILDLVDRETASRQPVSPNDRSLQIHVCHSPMREVEVLHDQLLALFDADPHLLPGDVAVLVPDITLYAPFIQAVFSGGTDAPFVPFGIADRGLAHEQPILETYLQLLDLPQSRFEADQVLSLLDQEAIQRRFQIGGEDLPLIHNWVRESGIRWGRDASQKAALGLSPESRHTWREGLSRIMLGYALPGEAAGEAIPLFHDLLPYDDIEGGRAQTFGRFSALLETLFEFADRLATPNPIARWADLLNEMAERMFAPDEVQEEALGRLRASLDLLRELGEEASYSSSVGVSVIKSFLSRQWQQSSSGSGFLTGGVTFCNLVPMRSLPFKVICLLGMNDGDFPRQQRPPGFDLIGRHPRRGDRSRRFDDRYLFLETLLSARQVLYISYVGRGIRDNSELPPSVLVADILDVACRSCERQDGGDLLTQIVTVHPLQPFNAAYFADDPKRPGYSDQWREAARLAGKGESTSKPLIERALPEPEAEWHSVELNALIRFFGNPARYLLQQRLGIDLRVADAVFDNREPFALDYFAREELRRQVLAARLQDRPAESAFSLAHAAGLLPHGGFGRALYEREQVAAEPLADAVCRLLPKKVLAPVEVHLIHKETTLSGWLNDLGDEGAMDYRLNDIKPRDLLQSWLRHLALCLAKPEGVALQSRLLGKDGLVTFGPLEHPETHLGRFLDYYRQGLHRPLPFFVKSSYAYVERIAKGADEDDALHAAHRVWDVPDFRPANFFGESENPYYQAVYRDADPLDEEFRKIALDLWLPMFDAKDEQ